jgi:hypothetical protein
MNWKLLLYITFIAHPNWAIATERFDSYRGIRQMGMGGASIGVVDDQTALLSNPAALGRLRDFYMTVADPVLEVGSQDDLVSGGSTNIPKMLDPQKALTQLKKYPGDRFHIMGEVFPSIAMPNFGIGVLGKLSEDAQVNKAGTAFEFDYTNDFALVTGFNFRFFGGILKLGTVARVTNRAEVRQTKLSPTATNLSLASLRNEGLGVASDIGMILTAPVKYLPSLSAVARDVGGTAYTVRKGLLHTTTGTPDRTPQTIDGAFTVQPIVGRRSRMNITFEMRDITNAYDDSLATQRYHAGFEFNYADGVFVRGGYNEGYWTAGLEFAISTYQIQITSYGEEVGALGALQEDRRYLGSFSIRF